MTIFVYQASYLQASVSNKINKEKQCISPKVSLISKYEICKITCVLFYREST